MICGFIQEDFFMFSISLCKTCGPLGQDHFWPQGHNLNKLGGPGSNLNKLGRGPLVLVMLHTKYQSSMPCGFRQEDFFMFSLYKPMYHM